MRNIFIPMVLAVAAGAAGTVQAEDAAALVKRDCMSCHGNDVYTRPNRMVLSLDGLRQQIARCHRATGKNWTSADVENVVQYLNATYYKF